MTKIRVADYTNEAASMGSGKYIREILEPLIEDKKEIVVDFEQITRFASPFFNNSFSALGIQYGFDSVENIQLDNLSEIGRETYTTSMENAKLLCENPKYKDEIEDIISTAPKKVEN